MAIEDWKLLQDGTLDLVPLLDARVAKTPLQVLLRLQVARQPEGQAQPMVEYHQLGTTPAQARQLAEAILEAVRRIDEETLGRA